MSRDARFPNFMAVMLAGVAGMSWGEPIDDLRAVVAHTRAATSYYEVLAGFPGKKLMGGQAWFFDGCTANEAMIDSEFVQVRVGSSVWDAAIEPGYYLSDDVERHEITHRAYGLFLMARRIPAAAVGAVLHTPTGLTVEALEGGGWLATAQDPGSPPYLPPSSISVRFDTKGVPREITGGDYELDLRYDPLYPEDAMVPAPELFAPMYVIDHLLVAEQAPEGAFTEKYLLTFVKKNPFIPSLWSREQSEAIHAAAGLEPSKPDPEYAEAVRKTMGKSSAWRWPLIGAGSAAVVIGVIAFLRRGAGA
ncbi:MAG: hypothetical protein IT439_08510 [Phycisphaerales bacterium]|nr:hypothetical protein [Phycisphaerales bacterium]